jgi:hypothetical protein
LQLVKVILTVCPTNLAGLVNGQLATSGFDTSSMDSFDVNASLSEAGNLTLRENTGQCFRLIGTLRKFVDALKNQEEFGSLSKSPPFASRHPFDRFCRVV